MALSLGMLGLSFMMIFSLLTMTFSTSYNHHQYQTPTRLKSLHLTLYTHETFNKTAFFTVKGITNPKFITKTPNPFGSFGSMFAFNDPITEKPNPTSKVIGYMEGSAVSSNFKGDQATCICRTTLNLKGYKGEIISVGTAYFSRASELPIIGGSGDFRFVQGYMTFSSVDLMGPGACYKTDFYLYWPPYATLVS